MPRAPLRLWPGLITALACAGTPPPLPPGVSATPALGDSPSLLLVKLRHAEDAGADVELRELRTLAVDREPWQPLAPEAVAAYPGRLAVIAGRRCHWREGLVGMRVDRGSWYVLEAGALFAFDHQGFGAGCVGRSAFEFLPADQQALERTLRRYLTQRFPPNEISGEERLARGLRLLALGRRDDAQNELFALDRSLRELTRRQDEAETPEPGERERLRLQEEQLRPLRAQLAHALRDDVSKEDERP